MGHDLERASVVTDEAAWHMAQKCRNIVQACLREEEWLDADREFFQVISAGIGELKRAMCTGDKI